MKQLTHNLLKMRFNGIDLNDVSTIEFVFSQNIDDAPLKTATYPSEDVVYITEHIVGVVWTKNETALFEAGKPFFADTRITMKHSEYQPETQIIKLKMQPTLFE